MPTPSYWLALGTSLALVAAALWVPAWVVPLSLGFALATALLPLARRLARSVKRRAQRPPPEAPWAPPGYTVGEQLASGTMGQIFRARHEHLDREVALKRIKSDHVDDEDRKRFEREARVLSGLQNPHTVQIWDCGMSPDGDAYFTMELLDGIDLQKAVRERGPFPPERVIHLLRQACASLKEAHAQGLVHRDIKPANLMICRYGGELDFLKLLDFGLVKKPADTSGGPRITLDGTVLGTPAYIAPESVSGSKRVDGRADLYALGAIGFWLLTGRLLFESERPLEMVQLHLSAPPPRASLHSPFEVPEALDQVLLDCLAKSPAARPPTAAALRRRLEQVPLASPWDQDRAADWWNEQTSLRPPRTEVRGAG